MAALVVGHRRDDGADAHQLAVVDLRPFGHGVGHAGDLVDHVLERTHLLEDADLLEEVVHVELPLEHPHRVLLGLLLVDDLLELLDQADHVAAAEDAAGHAVGAELLQAIGRLAHADELDRLAGDRLHRERGAAAGVAVELGEDDAVQVEAVVERLGRADGVLADHGVDDQQDVAGVGAPIDLGQLLHERLVDGEAAGGVEDDDVAPGLGATLSARSQISGGLPPGSE